MADGWLLGMKLLIFVAVLFYSHLRKKEWKAMTFHEETEGNSYFCYNIHLLSSLIPFFLKREKIISLSGLIYYFRKELNNLYCSWHYRKLSFLFFSMPTTCSQLFRGYSDVPELLVCQSMI